MPHVIVEYSANLEEDVSPRDLIDQILHPSKEINEQFVPVVIVTREEEMFQGVVVNLNGDGVTINTDLTDPNQRVTVDRKNIVSMEPSKVSPMPTNLLALLTREEIRDLQRSLRITTIYVTHDQEEALVISDRICVMQGGRVHQVAPPQRIYAHPETLFVGTFVGTMNVFGTVDVGPAGEATIGGAPCTLPALAGRRRVTLALRPEDVLLPGRSGGESGALALDGTVVKVTYAGREAQYRWAGEGGLEVLVHVAHPDAGRLAAAGDRLRIGVPLSRLHAFDGSDGRRIDIAP